MKRVVRLTVEWAVSTIADGGSGVAEIAAIVGDGHRGKGPRVAEGPASVGRLHEDDRIVETGLSCGELTPHDIDGAIWRHRNGTALRARYPLGDLDWRRKCLAMVGGPREEDLILSAAWKERPRSVDVP